MNASQYRILGSLSQQLPSYVRMCCRSGYDGTDNEVLDSFRLLALKTLSDYYQMYPFVPKHMKILEFWKPDMLTGLILSSFASATLNTCRAQTDSHSMPKRSCLHCPCVGHVLRTMREEVI